MMLERFNLADLETARGLLYQYMMAGRIVNGRRYAALPDTFSNRGVHLALVTADTRPALAVLRDEDGMMLAATNYGLLPYLRTPCKGFEGDALYMAAFVLDDMTCNDGTAWPADQSNWNTDDITYTFRCLKGLADNPALPEKSADTIRQARLILAQSLISPREWDVGQGFYNANPHDWEDLLSAEHRTYDGGGWYRYPIADGLLERLLPELCTDLTPAERDEICRYIRAALIRECCNPLRPVKPYNPEDDL